MTTITALPTPPSRSDPINFADRGDAFLGALPQFQSEVNLVAGEISTKHADVMSAEIIAYNVRGQWVTARVYAQKDVYTDNGVSYLVVVGHTSSSIAADLAAGKVTIHQGVTKSELAAPSGSSLVGHIPTGVGAVATTVDENLRLRTCVANYSTIQAAINATPSGGVLEFTAGVTYTLTAELLGRSDIELVGNGCTVTSSSRIRSYFNFAGCSNFKIHGFKFDLAKTNLTTYLVGDYPSIYNCGIYMTSCSNVEIYQNSFTNLYTRSIYSDGGAGRLDIHNNDFASPLQTQMYMLEHVAVGQNTGDIHVTKNRFINTAYTSPSVGVCGVTMSGTTGSADVSNNIFDYCGRDNTGSHRLGVIDFYQDQNNVTVKDNVVTNMMAMFCRINATNHAEISGNKVSTNVNVEVASTILSIEGVSDYLGVPAVVPGVTDINVHHNVFNGNAARTYGIGVVAYDYAYPSKNVHVHHNVLQDVDLAVSLGGCFDNVSITDNSISGVGNGSIQVLYTGGGIVQTALHGVTEAQSIYRNLRIADNRQMLTSAGASRAITVSLSKPTYLGVIREIRIEGNYAFSSAAGAGFAVFVEANSSLRLESFIVKNNTIQNWATGFYIRDIGELLFQGNKGKDVTTLYSDGGGITNATYKNNRYSNTGMVSGSQQLGGGGSMTVSTTEVRTGDKVDLQVKTLSGTPGFLSVGTISSGTSFVVNSSSATDSSTVYWEIHH
jgi:hypothetical protein